MICAFLSWAWGTNLILYSRYLHDIKYIYSLYICEAFPHRLYTSHTKLQVDNPFTF